MTPASRSPRRLRAWYVGNHRSIGTACDTCAQRPIRLPVELPNGAAPFPARPGGTGQPTVDTR